MEPEIIASKDNVDNKRVDNIVLKDNTKNQNDETIEKYLPTLKEYSHKSINNLLDNNSDIMLFSKNLDNDDFYEKPLWHIYNDKVRTNNIMGFVGLGSCNVRITSRFTNSNKDYFLHYMLQKVFLGQVINLDLSTNSDSVLDFYQYLFPYYLNKALSIGLYKEYIHKKYNDTNMRGAIDVSRHIKNNIPFQYKIAYNTREHSYNNKITHLIRHTIEYISREPFGKSILNCTVAVRENVDTIIHLSTDYNNSSRRNIIDKCRDKISNPYFSDYEQLRKICIKILSQEKLSLETSSDDKVHGILFDGSWLWEEYLATFMPSDFIHPGNKKRTEPIPLDIGKKLQRYPDFYSKTREIVLDAKYKHMQEDVREDTHQIITYMYALKSKRAILVYPSLENKKSEYQLKGYGNTLIQKTFVVASDNDKDFRQYCEAMKQSEDNFSNDIK